MLLGLLGAFGAALGYGVASVLQYLAAQEQKRSVGLDPRLLVRLLGSWRYVAGLGLDLAAFALSVAAVRLLPLFVVQAILAASLAVTAVVGARVTHSRLTRPDLLGLATVVAGLTLTALSAQADAPARVGLAAEWGVLAAVLLVGATATAVGRSHGDWTAAILGVAAGLAFGATSVATRMLPGVGDLGEALALLAHPAAYALVAAGVLAQLVYSTALQRGSVTRATAPLVVAETVVPALVGLAVLGDRPRPGWAWVATAGFALAVAGAVSLARHGEVSSGTDAPVREGVSDVRS